MTIEDWECKRKIPYTTREKAFRAIERTGDQWMRTYRCKHCHCHHIGHHKTQNIVRDWLAGVFDMQEAARKIRKRILDNSRYL